MFNLGYKEVVLNSDNGVYMQDGKLVIEGYGTFASAQLVGAKLKKAAEPAVGEVVDFAIPAGIVPPVDAWGNARVLAIGDVFECRATFRSMRNVSTHARDFIIDGKTLVWMSAPIAGVLQADIATAIAAGLALAVDGGGFGHEFEKVFEVVASTDDLEFTIQPGFEYITMKAVEIKFATSGGAKGIDLVKAAPSTVGNAGVGLGKWVEESRRMATPQNVMPYAQQHGGNSQGVDVRGMYTTYTFDFNGETTDGWASHEYVDHAYVSAAMGSKPTHYVVYGNEANAALLGLLDFLVA